MLTKGRQFLERTLQLADKLREAFNNSGITEGEVVGFRIVLLGLMDQMEGYAEAVLLLSSNGLSHTTIPIVRTIFETFVTAKLLDQDRDLLERFADFSWVNKERVLKTMTKYGQYEQPNTEEGGKVTADEIIRNAKEAMAKHKFRGLFWFPSKKEGGRGSLKSACEAVGELKNYELTYSHLSDIAHSGITTFHSYNLKDKSGLKEFSRLECNDDEANELSSAEMLLIVCNIFNTEFKLGQEEAINLISEQFR